MKNEQLDEFLYKNRLKSSDLVEFWGVTKGVVSQILNGTTKLPPKRLAELLNNDRGWDVSMLMDSNQSEDVMVENPEVSSDEQPEPDTSLVEYLKLKVAELEGKVEKLTDEKADLLQQNAVLKYENQLLAPQKGRNAEDAESFLSASAAQ